MAAAFPSLIPNMRTYTPGAFPSTPFKGLAGTEVRMRHGTIRSGHQLGLGFKLVPESVTKQIIDHFATCGTFETFTLPSAAFNGLSYSSALNPDANVWRYKDAPKVTYGPNGYHEVSVEFISIPA